jgi:hypothetical protein
MALEYYSPKTHKVVTNLQQTCGNAVPTTCQHGVFALLVLAYWQVVNGLLKTCYKVVELNRLITSCSKNLLPSRGWLFNAGLARTLGQNLACCFGLCISECLFIFKLWKIKLLPIKTRFPEKIVPCLKKCCWLDCFEESDNPGLT